MNEFERHFLLYAKHHYEKSDNIMGDLKTIVSVIAGIPFEYVPDSTIYYHLVDIFTKYSAEKDYKELLNDMFKWQNQVKLYMT